MRSRQRRTWLRCLPASALAGLLPVAAPAQAGGAWLLLGLGTASDRPYRACSLRLRALGDGSGGKGGIGVGVEQALSYPAPPAWAGKTWPYRTPQGQGELLLLPLPAGDYEIQDFELIQQTGETQRVARSRRPLRIRVQLREGRISYIGHYEAHDQGEPDRDDAPRDVLVLSDRLESAQRPLAAVAAAQVLRQRTPERQLPDLAALKHPQLLPTLGDR